MKTRSSRRPLAAVALATAVVLAAGALAPIEAAPARTGRHGRQPVAAAPATLSVLQHWVNRLLAAVGLPPATATPAGSAQSAPPPSAHDDNGAGIDPNG